MSFIPVEMAQILAKADELSNKLHFVVLFALVAFAGAMFIENNDLAVLLLTVSMILGSLVGLVIFLSGRSDEAETLLLTIVQRLADNDIAPCFATGKDGDFLYANKAAKQEFENLLQLMEMMKDSVASPRTTLFRLQERAGEAGYASTQVVMNEKTVSIGCSRLERNGYFWRIEQLLPAVRDQDPLEHVSLAAVSSDGTGRVTYMNAKALDMMGGRKRNLDEIFIKSASEGPTIRSVTTRRGPLPVRVVETVHADNRRDTYFVPCDFEEALDGSGLFCHLDAIPVALLKVDQKGKILALNLAAKTILDWTGQEDYLDDLVEGLGRRLSDWIAEAGTPGYNTKAEIIRTKRHAHDMFLQVTASSASGHNGDAIFVVLSDATKLKTIEAQFIQSQKMQAIGQLAGGVAHDFNNLLTAISGHCDLLLLRYEQRDPGYEDLMQIKQNANRAASLVGQLLAFSRKQTLTPRVLDIGDTLDELAHLLNRLVGEKVRLHLDYPIGLPKIRADKRQLEQVILNLVVNARDAMKDGGDIEVVATQETLVRPMMRDRATVPAGDYVVISVTDQGVGIPSDKINKIFEPFYTTKKTGEGTGLGLSMAYGIVKQTGGFIFVDSTYGVGTTFTIFLPTQKDGAGDLERDPVPSKLIKTLMNDRTGVVLLVEDEAPVRAFAARALRMKGHTVLEAENGEEALALLSDPKQVVDVFVSDVIMPGIDGPTWVGKALDQRPDVRVIFMSGYAEESFSEQQARIPNCMFLQKPFSLNELTSCVDEQLSAAEAESAEEFV